MMKFDMKTPCDNCPFRSDRPFPLDEDRVTEIEEGLVRGTFPCHKTVDYSREDDEGSFHMPDENEQHCAGALILLEKLEQPSQMMRIAERIGLYDRRKLDMEAPVYDDFDEMREGCSMGSMARHAKQRMMNAAKVLAKNQEHPRPTKEEVMEKLKQFGDSDHPPVKRPPVRRARGAKE